jgi:hypothetical protein
MICDASTVGRTASDAFASIAVSTAAAADRTASVEREWISKYPNCRSTTRIPACTEVFFSATSVICSMSRPGATSMIWAAMLDRGRLPLIQLPR